MHACLTPVGRIHDVRNIWVAWGAEAVGSSVKSICFIVSHRGQEDMKHRGICAACVRRLHGMKVGIHMMFIVEHGDISVIHIFESGRDTVRWKVWDTH